MPHRAHCLTAIDAHIDSPLYAIPDDDFSQLTEAAQEEIRKSIAADGFFDEASFAEPVFRQLRADHTMLATRNAGWRESDPRKIEDWFLEAIRDHEEGLRHVCRYLKGWRDHTWPKSRLSSLALMTCAVNIYEEFRGAPPKNRDDLALLLVVDSKLAARLGRSEAELLLFWLLQQGQDIVLIPGASKIDHLKRNLEVGALNLTDDEFRALDGFVRGVTLTGARTSDDMKRFLSF